MVSLPYCCHCQNFHSELVLWTQIWAFYSCSASCCFYQSSHPGSGKNRNTSVIYICTKCNLLSVYVPQLIQFRFLSFCSFFQKISYIFTYQSECLLKFSCLSLCGLSMEGQLSRYPQAAAVEDSGKIFLIPIWTQRWEPQTDFSSDSDHDKCHQKFTPNSLY